MVHIKIPLPWARMVCSGLVDTQDIGFDIGTHPCLVLVEAVKNPHSVERYFRTAECKHALSLAETLGLLSQKGDRTFGLVGVFTALPNPARESIWTYGGNPTTLYRVAKPMCFSKALDPTRFFTRKQILSMGETNILPQASTSGEELILPVCERLFNAVTLNSGFSIPLTETITESLFSLDCLANYRVLTLVCNNRTKSFVFENDNEYYLPHDENGNIKSVFSNFRGRNIVLEHFKFNLRTRIS